MDISDPRVDPSQVPVGARPLIIGQAQDEYRDLPAIVTPARQVITRWTPTEEERQRIAAGEDLFLTIIGTPIRPVLLTVGPTDWIALEQQFAQQV